MLSGKVCMAQGIYGIKKIIAFELNLGSCTKWLGKAVRNTSARKKYVAEVRYSDNIIRTL